MRKGALLLVSIVVVAFCSTATLIETGVTEYMVLPRHVENAEIYTLEVSNPTPFTVIITSQGLVIPYAAGGHHNNSWLEVNGDSLEGTTSYIGNPPLTLMWSFDGGTHEIGWYTYTVGCPDTLEPHAEFVNLQIMMFTEDGSTVAEQPPMVTPVENTSIIAHGPAVYVPSCTKVTDITGRTMDCNIVDGWVPVGELPSGTFFAERSDGGKTKIVNVR